MKRIQLRMSDTIRAELAYCRRQGGYKSWDEFFTVLLYKWNQRGPPSPVDPHGLQELKGLNKKIDAHYQAIRELMDARKEELQGLADEQERMMEVLTDLGEILQRAVQSQDPSGAAFESPSDDSGDEMIRKILSRRVAP